MAYSARIMPQSYILLLRPYYARNSAGRMCKGLPVMLKEKFHDRKISKLEGFVWKTMWAWLGGKSCFSRTNAPNFGGSCNRYFWDKRLKILGLGNINMPFQLVLTKLNCFRVDRKLIAWSCHAKSLLSERDFRSFIGRSPVVRGLFYG